MTGHSRLKAVRRWPLRHERGAGATISVMLNEGPDVSILLNRSHE